MAGTAVAGGAVGAAMANKKDQEKQAAVGLLVEAGIDFENAVMAVEKKAAELEKSAFVDAIGGYLGAKKGDKVGGTLTGMVTGLPAAIAGSKLGGLPGAVIGAGVGGYAGGKLYSHLKHHNDPKSTPGEHEAEKKAAVDMLVERGVDFDTAVELVTAKSAELA